MGERLDSEFTARLDDFADYAADERLACYVESLEVHYDNPLARRGAILVDTPGADSVYGRHTGLAFHYMKNADVILFVTYYNHAFSQADREFLLQLGRVKDSLTLDNMFFLVNAADLAGSKQEQAEVLAHAESSLAKLGIRKPRMYAISSREALAAKREGDEEALERSGFGHLERDFTAFLFEELAGQTQSAAARDIARARGSLEQRLRMAEAAAEEREAVAAQRELDATTILRLIANLPQAEALLEALNREVQEQFYYIRQRFDYRFGEWYQACFNPAALRRENGANERLILRAAWQEWTALVSRSLSQEALAASLRIEKAALLLRDDALREVQRSMEAGFPDFPFEEAEEARLPTPSVKEDISFTDRPVRWLIGFYKNSKHFFEGGGSDELRKELAVQVRDEIGAYLSECRETMTSHYVSLLRNQLQEASIWLRENFVRYREEQASSPPAQEKKAEWSAVVQKLRELEEGLEGEVRSVYGCGEGTGSLQE